MTSIIVASYNIHRGVGLDRRRDLDRIAGVIREVDPDAVGLQEVVCGTGADHADQAAYLARTLRMRLVMGETRAFGDGTYGNAVLTRLPVLGFERFDLSHPAREPRGCLRVDLAVNGGAVHLFNCHFGLAFRERRHQVHLLSGLIRSARLEGPRIVMGDFNEWHRGPVTRGFRREFASPMRRVRRTHPSVLPLFPLDRIYWDAELEGEEVRVHRSRRARFASDHLPVVARLQARHSHRRPEARTPARSVLAVE
jgi:endonuclease/exonuclease/phosphatase family metal-dependent hydrolase